MALSVLIAIQGSFVSLVLAREVGRFEGARRRLVLAMSAVTLGSSIWAMHFIGMLAYHMPADATYDLFMTLLSFLIAVLAVGVGYGIMTVIPSGNRRDVAAAIFTGGGIAGMHYVGMAAITGPVELGYQSFWIGISVLVGIVAAGISLHLAFGTKLQARAILGAVVMGLAISGMHYSAMYGTMIAPTDLAGIATSHVLDRNLLAIVVAIVAFVICATSMLLLVPNRPVTIEDGHALAGVAGGVLWERSAAVPPEPAGFFRPLLHGGRGRPGPHSGPEQRRHRPARSRRDLRHPGGRPLHPSAGRRAGILLQHVDHRAGKPAGPRTVRPRPSLPHRPDRARQVHPPQGRWGGDYGR